MVCVTSRETEIGQIENWAPQTGLKANKQNWAVKQQNISKHAHTHTHTHTHTVFTMKMKGMVIDLY